MALQATRITGRVLLQSNAPAFGCRVELRIADTTTIVSETWTSSRGEFVLDVPHGRVPVGSGAASVFLLEVIDGTGTMLLREKGVQVVAGATTHLSLLSGKRAMVTLPVALPLVQAHVTTIVRPETLALIDAAIGLLAPPGSHAQQAYHSAVRRPLPPPGHLEELLDLAWAALEGDPDAMSELRDVLSIHAAAARRNVTPPDDDKEAPRKPKVSYGRKADAPTAVKSNVPAATTTGRLLSSAPPQTAEQEGVFEEIGLEAGVSTARLMPLLVATVRISRSPEERVAFFDGLHGLLGGLSFVDRLYRAGVQVLEERRVAPMRALLALLLSEEAEETDTALRLALPPDLSSPGMDPLLPELLDTWWDQLQLCVRETVTALKPGTIKVMPYRIAAVAPAAAPEGTAVKIHGRGFGESPGLVVFPGVAPVEATAWSDTEIEVTVPQGARPGIITLRVLQGVVRIRRRLVEYYREGAGIGFEGGRPKVGAVLVDGRAEGTWVRPGEPAALSWTTGAGKDGRVDLEVRLARKDDAQDEMLVLLSEPEAQPAGSRILAIPEVDQEYDLIVRLRVENANAVVRRESRWPVATPPVLAIEDVEITQGIQKRPIAADAEPVPTVAGKDTIVRVFVSSDRNGFQDDRTRIVRGVLRIGEHALDPINGLTPVHGEPGAPFEAGRASSIDRGREDHTLNFRIPAPLCHGTRELQIELAAEGRPPEVPRALKRVTWTWTTVRPVAVRYLRVARRTAEGAVADSLPSDNLARFTLLRAFDLLPSPPDDLGPAWLTSWEAPLRNQGDPDDPGWDALLDEISDLHDGSAWEWLHPALDPAPDPDLDTLVVGVVDSPVNGRADTWEGSALLHAHDVSDGPDARARTQNARALAHLVSPTQGDERTRRAPLELGEVPFDPFWNRTVTDAHLGVHDLATDAATRWVSAATWRRLLEGA